MSERDSIRVLLALAGLAAAATAGSRLLTSIALPSLAPQWGIVLLTVLVVWSAASTWVLLSVGGPAGRPARTVAVAALGAAGGVVVPVSGVLLAAALLPLAGASLLGTVTVLGVPRLMGRHPRPGVLLLLSVPLLAVATALGIRCFVPPAPPATPAAALSPSDELRYLVATDQLDRRTGLAALDAGRDRARLRRTLALDAAGRIVTPEAAYAAALVLHHGACPDHYRRAHELARAAAEGGARAEWLVGAAYGRWMRATGRPQDDGTERAVSERCEGATP